MYFRAFGDSAQSNPLNVVGVDYTAYEKTATEGGKDQLLYETPNVSAADAYVGVKNPNPDAPAPTPNYDAGDSGGGGVTPSGVSQAGFGGIAAAIGIAAALYFMLQRKASPARARRAPARRAAARRRAPARRRALRRRR